MTVEMPDHFGGKPIPEDAIEIALAAEKKKKEGNEGKAPSLGSFIYVPSVNLYVAKERALLNHNWDDTHKKLHEQNLRMPTIPQFIEFLKYLRADPTTENRRVYNKITKARDPWKGEWLDAKFYAKDDELWVAYNHIINLKGDLEAKGNEKLEGQLMRDEDVVSLEHWLNNPTKQGLPQENPEQEDLWYWPPKENKVAKFIANGICAGLNCESDHSYSHSDLGVRAVRTRTQNAGGKQ